MREIARLRTLQSSLAVPAAGTLQITHLELSAQMRVSKLEQQTDVKPILDRLGGVAPINRGEMANVVSALAERLKAVKHDAGSPTPIVAFDIDLAPLEGGVTTDRQRNEMIRAITNLREHAHVIAVVLPRSDKDALGHNARNCFMIQAQCTRLNGGTAAVAAAAPSCETSTPLPETAKALFFASPRLFHQPGSHPNRYPYKLNAAAAEEKAKGTPWASRLPPYFPSLGTAIQQQHHYEFAHAANSATRHGIEGNDALNARQTLTALCEQAHAPAAGGELLEDWMSTPLSRAIIDSYDQRRLSWRLLDDPRLNHTTVDGLLSITSTNGLSDGFFGGPVLLVGIDGGAAYDKFSVAGIAPQAVSGAGIHALQALSIGVQSPLAEKLWGIFVDVVLSAAYSLLWYWAYRWLRPLRQKMPVVGGWLVAATPLFIGGLLVWACVRFVIVGMNVDLWINPIYIIAGLLIGIYVDAWNDAERDSQAAVGASESHSGLYGLGAAREALRSGFGQRLDSVRFAVTSGYHSITGMDDLRIRAQAVRSQLGAAALADALLSALLRVVVLLVGWFLILKDLFDTGRA